jgi:hypothetical protein
MAKTREFRRADEEALLDWLWLAWLVSFVDGIIWHDS